MKEELSKFTTFALINATLDEAKDFAKSLGTDTYYEFIELKLNDVNYIRAKSYEYNDKKIAFIIGKANLESQNALLKLTEEPIVPNYFIFYETEYIIDTLLSRAQKINFHIETKNIDKLYNAFAMGKKNEFIMELINIKNSCKQNKAVFLKYVRSLINRICMDIPDRVGLLMEEYKNLRELNLNIDLFIANLCIIVWGNDEYSLRRI